MKIKDGFMLKKVMGSYMIISTDDTAVNNMQTLNETGAFLWNLLSSETTEAELLQKLRSEYEVDEETAKADICAFVSSLAKAGLLD